MIRSPRLKRIESTWARRCTSYCPKHRCYMVHYSPAHNDALLFWQPHHLPASQIPRFSKQISRLIFRTANYLQNCIESAPNTKSAQQTLDTSFLTHTDPSTTLKKSLISQFRDLTVDTAIISFTKELCWTNFCVVFSGVIKNFTKFFCFKVKQRTNFHEQLKLQGAEPTRQTVAPQMPDLAFQIV